MKQFEVGKTYQLKNSREYYKCLEQFEDGSIKLRRTDAYIIIAHHPIINDNGTIEWGFSTRGHFEE